MMEKSRRREMNECDDEYKERKKLISLREKMRRERKKHQNEKCLVKALFMDILLYFSITIFTTIDYLIRIFLA